MNPYGIVRDDVNFKELSLMLDRYLHDPLHVIIKIIKNEDSKPVSLQLQCLTFFLFLFQLD